MMFFRSKNAKIITLVAAILVIVIIVYAKLVASKDNSNKQETDTPSQVQKLLDKDYSKEYPESVREVVRTYFKTIECLYNEELSEDDFIELADIERELLDDELLKKNPYGEFMERLKKEVSEYKNNNTKIAEWDVEKNDDIQYWYHEEYRYASLLVTIHLSGNRTSVIGEKFILRCDENGRWKILGWEEAQKNEGNEIAAGKKSDDNKTDGDSDE